MARRPWLPQPRDTAPRPTAAGISSPDVAGQQLAGQARLEQFEVLVTERPDLGSAQLPAPLANRRTQQGRAAGRRPIPPGCNSQLAPQRPAAGQWPATPTPRARRGGASPPPGTCVQEPGATTMCSSWFLLPEFSRSVPPGATPRAAGSGRIGDRGGDVATAGDEIRSFPPTALPPPPFSS